MSKPNSTKALKIDAIDNLAEYFTQKDVNDWLKRIKEINNMTEEQKKVLLEEEGSEDVED